MQILFIEKFQTRSARYPRPQVPKYSLRAWTSILVVFFVECCTQFSRLCISDWIEATQYYKVWIRGRYVYCVAVTKFTNVIPEALFLLSLFPRRLWQYIGAIHSTASNLFREFQVSTVGIKIL